MAFVVRIILGAILLHGALRLLDAPGDVDPTSARVAFLTAMLVLLPLRRWGRQQEEKPASPR